MAGIRGDGIAGHTAWSGCATSSTWTYFVPADGESLASLAGMPEPGAGVGEEWLVPPLPRTYEDEAEAEFMTPRRVAHPLACFTERVRLEQPLEDYPFARTYIRPSRTSRTHRGRSLRASRRRARAHVGGLALPRDRLNHMVASNRPAELSGLLIACVHE